MSITRHYDGLESEFGGLPYEGVTTDITAPLISGTGTVYTPTISTSATIGAPLVSGSGALFTPAPSATADVTAPLVSGSGALFTPAVSADASITSELTNGSAALFTPTLSTTAAIDVPLISGTGTVFTPAVSTAVIVSAPLISGSATTFDPTITYSTGITTGSIGGTGTIFQPQVDGSNVNLTSPLISGTATLFAVSASASTSASAPLVSGSATTYTPSLESAAGITTPTINGSAALFAPTISYSTGITAPLISGSAALSTPTVSVLVVIVTFLVSGSATLFTATPTAGGGSVVPYVPGSDPGTVQQSIDTLGCGQYEVYFKTRGGDLFICRALNITSLTYGRVLNGISEASIEFGLTGQQGNCCECVALINPWQHEMSIYRDGEEVWCGPVTGGEINDGNSTGTFQARDLSAWFSKRWVEVRDTDQEFEEADIITVFNWLIGHAYYKDPWGMEWLFTTDRLGVPIDRTYISFDTANERWGGNYPMVEDELNSLVESGVDYTVIRRVLLAGDLQSSLTATTRFSDAHWVSPPSIIITGNGMATQVAVAGGGGGSEGWYDDQIWIERPYDSYREQFGLLQHFESESKLDEVDTLSVPNAVTQRAYGLREIKKKPFEYINGGSLSRHAPVTMDQLIPGKYFRVDLNQTCRNIQGNYMLTRVSVTYNDEEENIQIDLTPPGAEEVRG